MFQTFTGPYEEDMDIFDARSAKVMLAGGEGPAFDDPGYIFELKLDGDRCLAYLDGESTVLVSRRARYVTRYFPELENMHRQVRRRCILDGELVIGSGRKPDFELLRMRTAAPGRMKGKLEAAAHPATFLAFDILYVGGEETLHLPLIERKAVLDDTLSPGPRASALAFIAGRGKDFFRLASEQGLEGVMAKKTDGVYRMGKRADGWIKCKNWDRDAFVICGYQPSEKANVVSLILAQYKSHGFIYAGRVVLGRRTDAFRTVAALPQAEAAVAIPPEDRRNSDAVIWVRPQLVCRVEFICRTASGAIRQPVFKELLPGRAPEEALWPETFACGPE